MAQLVIDISGSKGLGPHFYGDDDQTTSTPASRMAGTDGQLAEGFFNPFLRYGHLSGAVATLGATTFDGTLGAIPSSSIYDAINDDYYFAERGRSIWKGDGLDDTSFDVSKTLDNSGAVGTDIEIYQLNGVRKFFYSYQQSSTTFTADASTDLIAVVARIANGTTMTLTTTNSLPGGLSAGTTYYAVQSTAVSTKLSSTLGGAAINITSTGAGTHTATGSFGCIGVASLPFSDLSQGWLAGQTGSLSTTLSTPFNLGTNGHKMIVADDGFMYVLDGNALHRVDGTVLGGAVGTVSANVLTIPPYMRMVDGIDYRGLLFIAIHQTTLDPTTAAANGSSFSTPAGVYLWDKLSSINNTKDFISLPGVKSIQSIYVSPTGSVRIICIASNGIAQIREYDGNTFKIIKQLGLGGAPQYPDGLAVGGLRTYWLATNGAFFAHGVREPGEEEILAKIGYVKAPSTSPGTNITAGAILYGASNTFEGVGGYRQDRQGFTISYNDGSGLVIKKFYPHDKGTINSNAQLTLQGDIYTGKYLLPSDSDVRHIDIYCHTGTSTGSTVQATVKIYFNGSATAWASKTISRDDISRGHKHIPINKQFVNSIQLEIEYPTNSGTGDSFDFTPSTAIVTYDDTTTGKETL